MSFEPSELMGPLQKPAVQFAPNIELRDYIAACALQGMLAHPEGSGDYRGAVSKAKWSHLAYDWADAMLLAREP